MANKGKAGGKKGATSSYRPFYLALGVIALVGIGLLGWTMLRSRTGATALQPIDLGALADSTQALYQQAVPVKAGPDSARVRIVVFSDYTCPYCGRFAAEVQPRLMKDYVDPGKVQLIYYDFPLGSTGEHQYSFLAARSARCAGEQGRYWSYHDLIFGQQSDWSFVGQPPVSYFEQDAAQLGLDAGQFKACLESNRYADVVSADRLLAERLGIDETPTVIVNEQRIENPLDYASLTSRIDSLLAAAR